MSQKILLFDFDGTLADTLEPMVRTYNQVAKEAGYRLITKENLPKLREKGLIENAREMGVPLWGFPFMARRIRKLFWDEVPRLKSFPGIPDALRELRKKGCEMYILSSNSKENIEAFLEFNQIGEFSGVYSASNLFGKHTKILELIEDHGWQKESVVYVGDEVRDIEASQRAGIAVASVAWGYNTADSLRRAGSTFLLFKPEELLDLV